ncbi:MAG: hypothetical protein HOO96_11740 [Polyangiaceae bacterium]|nr:hypothetical protein [Polyangiaceae bacterium]
MSPAKLLCALVASLAMGCEAPPPVAPSPGLDRSATPVDESESARRAAAEATARVDFACPQVATVMAFDRRYANSSSLRYVIEGCGTRGTYAEACQSYPQCRYLLVAKVPMP